MSDIDICVCDKKSDMDNKTILVVGDIFIPDRKNNIPKEFQDLIKSFKIDLILCTGNVCSKKCFEMLEKFCSKVIVTEGEYDNDRPYTEFEMMKIGAKTILMFHGHQIIPYSNNRLLKNTILPYDPNIVIFGSSHKLKFFNDGNIVFIDPGSLTGAFHPVNNDVKPSFIVLNVSEKVHIDSYTLIDSEVQKVSQTY